MNSGRLTTHVLDTSTGRPAVGLAISLSKIDPEAQPTALVEAKTNEQGRTDRPLLEGQLFEIGRYELSFAVGDYYAEQGATVSDPPFLDVIAVRFALAELTSYHVPLLVTPWAYSVYRGS